MDYGQRAEALRSNLFVAAEGLLHFVSAEEFSALRLQERASNVLLEEGLPADIVKFLQIEEAGLEKARELLELPPAL